MDNIPLSLHPGEYHEVLNIVLAAPSDVSTVHVTASQHEIAEAQMRAEEKQRVLGIVPNFYVSYNPDALSLSAGQKVRLATRTSIDPLTLLSAGFIAGAEQSQNYFSGFGFWAALPQGAFPTFTTRRVNGEPIWPSTMAS